MHTLYNNLMALVDSSDPSKFFYKDFKTASGNIFRVFSYQFVSYNDWLLPNAKECRGIMFEITDHGNPIRIAARPMEKFFNVNENPMTIGLDLSKMEYMMDKADGSLISSYIENDTLYLKSKASLTSSQAQEAMELIDEEEYAPLKEACTELAKGGFTVNMEYCSPTNRIVLNYDKPQLIVLNVRNNSTGEYVQLDYLALDGRISPHLVEVVPRPFDGPSYEIEEAIRNMEGIEGYVIRMKDQFVKLKTKWYVNLHNTRSSIESSKSLFEVIVGECQDDLRSFFTDNVSRMKIDAYENAYVEWMSKSLTLINMYYENNKQYSRKDYAISGQKWCQDNGAGELFSILMSLYMDPKFDVISKLKEVFLKNYELFVPDVYK